MFKKAMIKYEKFHNLQRKIKRKIYLHSRTRNYFAINDFDINSEQWIFLKLHINLDSNKTGRYDTKSIK